MDLSIANITVSGSISTTGSRLNALQALQNTQLNGFTSIYFNNTNGASLATAVPEIGQIFCGQTVGLNLCTNTAHPIKFTTYNNAATQCECDVARPDFDDLDCFGPHLRLDFKGLQALPFVAVQLELRV